MSWKSTLFALLSIFVFNAVNGQSCGETFYDSGGENAPYDNVESMIWTICPDNEGDLVTIDFTFVDIEGGFDFLSVFSGSNTDFALTTELTDPQSFTSFSSDGCLTITFTSDGSVTNQGWEATISCDAAPACGDPAFLTALPTATGGILSWLQVGDISMWDLEIGPAGFTPTGTPTIAGVSNPYTWEGGESEESYDFYVRADCGDSENSDWTGPYTFTTVPACGEIFYDNGGPDGVYPPNENEIWVFCPDEPGDQVTINFTFVELGLFGSALSVYNGIGQDGLVLNPFVIEPSSYTSNAVDGCLTVTFFSGAFLTEAGWEAEILCLPCTPTLSQDVFIEDINAFNAQIAWFGNDMDSSYEIEYDTTGFLPGTGNVMSYQDTTGLITGLEENTTYDYYLTTFCSDGQLNNTVGPFTFTTLFNNDLGITGLITPSGECGLGENETFLIEITNFGSAPQTLFGINYAVNGESANVGMPQDGFYTGIISNDSTEVFEFDMLYDFDGGGDYLIQVWTELEGEGNTQNDTFSITITNYAAPFMEDFESGVIPSYITTTPDDNVGNDHNSGSFVLFDNLFFQGDTLKAELPVIGPITEDDVLFFDFRYTDWFEGEIGTILTAGDILTVLISEDCGDNYETAFVLTGNNHEPTAEFNTIEVPLNGYVDARIKIQILGIYGDENGEGDYWLDIDNINIPTCDNIALNVDVDHATTLGSEDGAISVLPSGGIAPYTYLWEDGSTDPNRTDLTPGLYTVLLTDRFDCTLSTQIEVSAHTVGVETLPSLINHVDLMPNPTSGKTVLKASFAEALPTQVEVVNLYGQIVWKSERQEKVNDLNLELDLSGLPSAMYLVRIYAGNQMATSKLLKAE